MVDVVTSTAVRSDHGSSVPPAPGGMYVLHVTMWDLHAARRLADRFVAAGVPRGDVRVRGRRREDGLQEAQVRPRGVLTTRWRGNVAMALTAALVVGLPMGASAAIVLLGEQPLVATVGALAGCMGLAATGVTAVWADHTQRRPASRHASRVEGHVCVIGSTAVVRAELLLATTDEVVDVARLPVGADPLDW